MNYEITGKIKVIMDAETFPSGFTKRDIVITTDGDYPQDIIMQFVNDKVSILDKYEEGDHVTIGFNLDGREYNGRYFTNLKGWKIFKSGDTPKTSTKKKKKTPKPDPVDDYADEFDDDIPF